MTDPTPSAPPGRSRSGTGPGSTRSLEALVDSALERHPRSLGRVLSILEDGVEGHREIVARIYPRTGNARIIGLTGPPGAGKSTLVERLAGICRQRGETVGVLAVDPTSPFSGGALLGDRVRMQSLYTDPGVFIRSMATRGAMGGLTPTTHDAIDLLDAAGFDWVFVETVGVGQDEVDVVRTVDTVLLATVPGLGDEIQAIKAGIMEIADVFVVNKADRDGTDRTVRDLKVMLEMAGAPSETSWTPPIVRTIARDREGLDELRDEIERHYAWLQESGELSQRRFARLRQRVETILKARILAAADRTTDLDAQLRKSFEDREDPYRLADRLFSGVVQQSSGGEQE